MFRIPFKKWVAATIASTMVLGSLFSAPMSARASNLGSAVPFEDPLLFPPGQGQSQNQLPPTSSGSGSQTAIPEPPLARVGQNNVPETGPGRI